MLNTRSDVVKIVWNDARTVDMTTETCVVNEGNDAWKDRYIAIFCWNLSSVRYYQNRITVVLLTLSRITYVYQNYENSSWWIDCDSCTSDSLIETVHDFRIHHNIYWVFWKNLYVRNLRRATRHERQRKTKQQELQGKWGPTRDDDDCIFSDGTHTLDATNYGSS